LANLEKCEFSQQSLVFFGYVIGGGDLKIDHENMEPIIKWKTQTNATKLRRFLVEKIYYWKFRESISAVVAPLISYIANNKIFWLGKNKQKYFEVLKWNISQAIVLSFLNLKNPFEVETYASEYVNGSGLDARR
jgi:hypothetical protein